MKLQYLVVFIFFHYASCKEIPSYVRLCNPNDPNVAECFTNTIYEILPHLVQGIPEMDVPSIDPLGFHSINVTTGNGNAVNMDVWLLNGTVSGLKNLKLLNHTMDFEHIKFFATLLLDRIEILATYKMNGKILLFEINGMGHASFNASDVRSDGVWDGSVYVKKNKKHIKIDTIKFKNVKLKNMRVRLDDIFQNNDLLTDTVNKAINDNIDNLQEELEPIIKETLAEIIKDYFNRVYNIFPMEQLYPTNAPFYKAA